MRAVWLTDIHLNFLEGKEDTQRFIESVVKTDADMILLGGDIGEAASLLDYLDAVSNMLSCPVYFVLGNHDFYGDGISAVRQRVEAYCQDSERMVYLNTRDPIRIGEQTALLGHDGWPDGRLGDYANTEVMLNDFLLIKDFEGLGKIDRLSAMQTLADQAASHFKTALAECLVDHAEIIALTHVPPFREASWFNGKPSSDDYLPFFACYAVGKVMRDMMEAHPDCRLTVLCGHTHGSGTCDILPNLHVRTGGARYGKPEIQTVLNVL